MLLYRFAKPRATLIRCHCCPGALHAGLRDEDDEGKKKRKKSKTGKAAPQVGDDTHAVYSRARIRTGTGSLCSSPHLTVIWIAVQPSYEATAKVRNNASKAFSSESGRKEKPKKVKDPRKVGSRFKSKKRFKRR